MSVASEYFKLLSEYRRKYGDRTAVLMQVGSFYEIYGVDNDKQKIGNAEELSQMLNIVLTKKNKRIESNDFNNPLMMGFPCLALNKYLPVFMNEQYTVVIVDQVKSAHGPLPEPSNRGFRRSVVNVVSPSTYIDGSHDDSYLVCIYVDKHMNVGMSAISVITGNSTVHECYCDPNDKDAPLDGALGFIKQYRPKEVVIYGAADKNIASHLELGDIMCHWISVNASDYNTAYQNAVLGFAFSNSSLLSNIEYLDLELMPYATMSYVLLVEFVHGHNPLLIARMSKPSLFTCTSNLVLSTSTLDQLNVTPPKLVGRSGALSGYRLTHASGTSMSVQAASKHNLFSVVNKCCTRAGQRMLFKRLTAPSSSAQRLNKMYDQIHEFGVLFGSNMQDVDRLLKKTSDIERLHRRLVLGIMTPSELASMVDSYINIVKLDRLLCKAVHLPRMKIVHRESLQEFVDTCVHAFDMGSMRTCDAETAAFNEGVFSCIDKLRSKIKKETDAINRFAGVITGYGIDGVRVEYTQNAGYCVTVSSARAKKIPGTANVTIKNNRTVAKITSSDVDAANVNIQSMDALLKERTKRRYKKALEYLSTYYGTSDCATRFLSSVDVARSNYVVKEMYNYCRPTIVTSVPSFVDAKGLRHAIVERVDNGNEYVPNDVALGKDNNGIILYSMNSCGKTSMLKAIGLSVILAQAGCFVPASSFSISPFKCIMSRILSRDNIMKGQSSFVAEMSELRAILKRAVDPSTLVLADEITHGTEHTSGSAIFVSSVETLAKRRVNFVFTTHLHNVYPFVRSIPNVRTCHLSVAFEQNSIRFERKLKNGPGGSVYGLEVCDHLNMDADFLLRAFHLRNMITPDKTEKNTGLPTLSRYNKGKVKIACERCGYSPKLHTDLPLHTHHIKERHRADQNGMIDGVHKNAVSNLMVLCKQCHNKEHIDGNKCDSPNSL